MSSGSRKVVKILANGKDKSLCAFFTNVSENSSCGFVSEDLIKIIEKRTLLMKILQFKAKIFTFSVGKTVGKLRQVTSAGLDCPCTAV